MVDKAGVQMDMESGKPVIPGQDTSEVREEKPVREDELKGLSAFQDFIGQLDLEDIGTEDNPSTSN